jgi:hypothetical protein
MWDDFAGNFSKSLNLQKKIPKTSITQNKRKNFPNSSQNPHYLKIMGIKGSK